MSLVECRACGHQVDTSALACPGCGATDPGKSISRQQRNGRVLIVQWVVGLSLLGLGGLYTWNHVIPLVKQQLVKPAP
jgi:hypothetical protein